MFVNSGIIAAKSVNDQFFIRKEKTFWTDIFGLIMITLYVKEKLLFFSTIA